MWLLMYAEEESNGHVLSLVACFFVYACPRKDYAVKDPMITADRGFIQILGPDFGFCLFGSSDRGSQRPPGKLTFSFLSADVTQWRK